MWFLQSLPHNIGILTSSLSRWVLLHSRNASGSIMNQAIACLQLYSHLSTSACVAPVVSDDVFDPLDAYPVQQPPRYGLFSRTASMEGFPSSEDDKLLDWALESVGKQGTIISDDLYLIILKACIKKKSIAVARQVQSRLSSDKSEVTGLLYEHLILSLAKCGAVDDAIHLFDRLRCRTIFAWTAIISGLTEQNRHLEAIKMYEYMREEGVEPDRFTFISLFKACGCIPDVEKGRQLHILAKRMGFASNVFVGNTLVNLYGKCGSIVESECVFSGLLSRNVVSWTAMISAFVCLLQACTMLADSGHEMTGKFSSMASEIGKAFHIDAHRMGHSSDLYVATSLINFYGKCGAIQAAEDIFATQLTHNVVSWTAMLSAFVEQEEGEKALLLYRQMYDAEIRPNECTLVSALQACSILAEKGEHLIRERTLYVGQSIHADIRNYGLSMNFFLSNSLLKMYAKHGSMREAENVLASLSQFTVVTWTLILSAYIEERRPRMALQSYRQMQAEGIQPNQQTFVIALQACSALAVLSSKKQRHMEIMCQSLCESLEEDMQRMGFSSDPFVIATLLSTYGKCGAVSQAEEVFYKSSQCDTVMWNAILSAFIEQGLNEKALQLYKSMILDGMPQDDVTIISVLHSCCETSSLEPCRELHFCIVFNGLDLYPTLASSLIHLYGKCASAIDAEAVYAVLTQPDVVCSNALMGIYSWEGNDDASLKILHQVMLQGSKLDAVTFALLLSACSHAGSVQKSIESLKHMKEIYGITPDLMHNISVADLLGRARDMNRFENILQRIPLPTNKMPIFGKYYDNDAVKMKFQYCDGDVT